MEVLVESEQTVDDPASARTPRKPLSAISHRMIHPAKLERKHSSGDLHSRLKTRKILGVGETDNGDIHRSKISQLLGHNEHLYVRFPRGYWGWHLIMALTFTFLGLNNLFVPHGGLAVSAREEDDDSSSPSSYLASRYHGCTSLAVAFLLWAFWGTSDKAVARCLLIAIGLCHILQAIAVILELLDGFSCKWQMYFVSFARICLAFPNIYFYKGIGLCGLRMRKSNSFSDLRDCQPMGNHLRNGD